MKTELWRLFEAKSALWDSLSALVMGLLMAPWPEPMNVLLLHFSVGAKGEYPPQDHVNKAPFSLRKRCKSNQSSLAWLICHPSPSQHVQSSSVQRPTPPRNDPFKAQPPGMGSLFESQKSPCLHMLNIYSLETQSCLYVSIPEIYNEDPLCQRQCFMLWGEYRLKAIH